MVTNMPQTENEKLTLRLDAIRYEAESINSYEFSSLKGKALPGFSPGSHIEIHLDNGMSRSYSLLNSPSEKNRYVIAVARDENGRGGSKYFHDTAQVGKSYSVGRPKNNFPLVVGAKASVFIAGGIGITPVWSMAQYLNEIGEPWKIYYRARAIEFAALLKSDFYKLNAERIHVVFDAELSLRGIEREAFIESIVSQEGSFSHYYCCGPNGMLEAFKSATKGLATDHVHFEYFSPLEEAAREGGFSVILNRKNITISVAAGQSILDALLANNIEIANSCREGVCGACEVGVLCGTPDHRDSILSEAERKSGKTMFVCCSGAHSKSLTLDI